MKSIVNIFKMVVKYWYIISPVFTFLVKYVNKLIEYIKDKMRQRKLKKNSDAASTKEILISKNNKIMKEEKKLGIELTKDLSKDMVMLIKEGVKAYSDDKTISTAEWFGLVDDFIPVLTDLTKAKQILMEIKDFDTSEGKEFAGYLLSLGIVGDKASRVAGLIVGYIEYQVVGYEKYLKPIIEELKKQK